MRRAWVVLLVVAAACGERRESAKAGGPDAGSASPLTVIATCADVNGQAQVRRAGKPYWEPLAAGGTLRDGDWVRTLDQTHARLEFLQGGSLELSENAVVVVELPSAAELPAGVAPTSPRVSVAAGEVQAVPAPGKEADELAPLLIRTADGKTTVLQPVKGAGKTAFRLSASDAGVAVSVSRGKATLRSGDSQVALSAGNAAVLGTEAPPAAVQLPDFPASIAPGIDARVLFEEGVTNTRLQWGPVPGAAGYRIQVARDFSFTIQARIIDLTLTSFALRPESKGLYVWRVATKGQGGVVGEYGFARRIFFEGEEPKDLLLGPEDATTVTFAGSPPNVSFTWVGADKGPTYRLLISKGADPQNDALISVATTAQRLDIATLGAGEYRWGVYIDGKVLKPLFLKPRKLTVKAVPRASVKTPNKINKWE
ncbi:MAG: hypothetical protein IPJ65_17425 [Archangiaceae bacterium]|nr:hypothetical protein [Archangiaceae bacterium]